MLSYTNFLQLFFPNENQLKFHLGPQEVNLLSYYTHKNFLFILVFDWSLNNSFHQELKQVGFPLDKTRTLKQKIQVHELINEVQHITFLENLADHISDKSY